ncbi:4-alpha-glucanotransferase [Coralloluteibacterium thermophilus]|uniref:4-alpha-glucanotransferase n=1 Tax=Coralloluteibacterium thermophilum TaxID=2707049 RepID=A0ABV9NFY1_9GAMM
MSDAALHALARAAGLSIDWRDAFDSPRTVAPDTLRRVLGTLGLPAGSDAEIAESQARLREEQAETRLPALVVADAGGRWTAPPGSRRWRVTAEDGSALGEGRVGEDGRIPVPGQVGYHRLALDEAETTLAVAPARAYGIDEAAGAGARLAGIAAQLYSLRREGDGGVGDFTALAQLVRAAARHGIDAAAISPVHAMFAAAPERFSPYSPSSRLFYNWLHVDPAEVFGADALAGLDLDAAEREALAAREHVDWPRVARHRRALLAALFERIDRFPSARDAFVRWRAQAGEPLARHARFEALQAHFAARDGEVRGWQGWDADFRSPESAAVAGFADAHAHEVAFHAWLQYLAHRGLEAGQRAARDAGMRLGLIADLAVGSDPGGSQAWSHGDEMLQGVSVGAPPDMLNAQGQDWGLTTFSPRGLRASGFAGFRAMLRAAFAHAGGARIDHILGLKRLWLIPHGAGATEGAYLDYPFDDLCRLIALESHLHRAVVIGEDLGTIPEGFGDQLAERGILGIRVLWFERERDGGFRAPARWSRRAMATTTTHDLPSASGWWRGRDIEHRQALGLCDDAGAELRERERDARRLWEAMLAAGTAEGPPPPEWDGHPVARAAAATIGATPAPLAVLPLEDVLGLTEQPNLPGPTDEGHPNWRRRLPVHVDTLFEVPIAHDTLDALTARRRD